MIPFPDHFDDRLGEVPAERMSQAGLEAIETLKSKGYEVRPGLTPE